MSSYRGGLALTSAPPEDHTAATERHDQEHPLLKQVKLTESETSWSTRQTSALVEEHLCSVREQLRLLALPHAWREQEALLRGAREEVAVHSEDLRRVGLAADALLGPGAGQAIIAWCQDQIDAGVRQQEEVSA